MHGVFITGTSTAVGKTFIASAIARELNQRGISVIPRKPVESGCIRQGDELLAQDAAALKQAAAYQGHLSTVCPYRFEHAVSPARAAQLSNRRLSIEQLLHACLEGSEQGFLLVEGAGGFYSPLTGNGLNADLAVALKLPVLLIADDQLGVINQVLLNVEAIARRGLALSGIVINAVDDKQNEHMDNAAELRERVDCPLFYSPRIIQGPAQLPEELYTLLISSTAG